MKRLLAIFLVFMAITAVVFYGMFNTLKRKAPASSQNSTGISAVTMVGTTSQPTLHLSRALDA